MNDETMGDETMFVAWIRDGDSIRALADGEIAQFTHDQEDSEDDL